MGKGPGCLETRASRVPGAKGVLPKAGRTELIQSSGGGFPPCFVLDQNGDILRVVDSDGGSSAPWFMSIMPIRSLLSETSFNTDQTEMIVKAFDDAWAKVQIDEAEPAMASLVRTSLAKRIIEMAHHPGVDVQKLRDDAIAYVKNNPLWPSLWRAPP
jgi:hypothetical protein